jgi:hypothetical protein
MAITYATNRRMDKRVEEIGNMSPAILNATNKAEEERARQAYVTWISGVDFSAQQSDNLERRQGNTGAWFLKDPVFTSWADGSPDCWCLMCPGAPGAGKTTMTAAAIDHLSRADDAPLVTSTVVTGLVPNKRYTLCCPVFFDVLCRSAARSHNVLATPTTH